MMRVQLAIPDAASARRARSALHAAEMQVTEGPFERADIRVVDADLLPRSRDYLRSLTRDAMPVIVANAPCDPETLAVYLAGGVNAYLCREESWALLPQIVRDVHAGGYRYNPSVMMSLLTRYRALQKSSAAAGMFGPYIH